MKCKGVGLAIAAAISSWWLPALPSLISRIVQIGHMCVDDLVRFLIVAFRQFIVCITFCHFNCSVMSATSERRKTFACGGITKRKERRGE